jgi:signal transduction histidine kinase
MLRFLIQANLKVQESVQEQSNFLARSVHDFQAPLTAVSGYCAMLLDGELGPLNSEQRRVLQRILKSTSRMASISDGMYHLSVPHNVDHALKLERADFRECLDQALREVALPLGDKRISVVTEIEPGTDGLFFERSQLKQALVNLLENACKFSSREGTIKIKGYPFFWERRTRQVLSFDRTQGRRMRRSEAFNSFRVDIRDSGPGIPPEQVERIFEQFTAYGGAQDRSGGGLSLAICRMIINRHHGRLWAESSPLGAMFSFVLPLHQTMAHPSKAVHDIEATSFIRGLEN